MLDKSLFIERAVHSRPVTLADGSKHEFNFRELTNVEFRMILQLEASPDPEIRASALARAISLGVVLDDGSPAVTYDEATMLRPAVAMGMWAEIIEVNKFTGKASSPPEAVNGSDTPSRSPSEKPSAK